MKRWIVSCALTLSVLGIVFFIVPNSTWDHVQLGWPQPGPAQVVSVSEDGRYVVSSHADNRIVLWDVEERRSEVVSDRGNIYSAYFIQGVDAFLWQGLDDVVRVQHVDGRVLERFEHFPTYGHVMTADGSLYIASDVQFHLYAGWGDAREPVKTDSQGGKFRGTLVNLMLNEAEDRLFSVGHGAPWGEEAIEDYHPLEERRGSRFDGPVVWDLTSHEPLQTFGIILGKAHGDLSPDGTSVVAVDERGVGSVWDAVTGEERWRLPSYSSGLFVEDEDGETARDDSGLIDQPEGEGNLSRRNVGVQFVAEEWFVRVPQEHSYAALHHIDSPWHQAFLDLGDDPAPASHYIPAVDATPVAHVLVTGQRYPNGGINVYRFDPETQALETVWKPRGWLRWLQWLDRL